MIDIKILEGTAHRIQNDYRNVVRAIYVNQISDHSLFDKAIKVYMYFKDGTKMTRIINANDLINLQLGPTGVFYDLLNEMIEVKSNESDTITYLDKNALAKHLREVLNCTKSPIEKVIFNDPATIVFWADGTKTVVKAHDEIYDPEKGLAMAIAKKHLGNQGNYYNTFTKWLPEEDEELGELVCLTTAKSLKKAAAVFKNIKSQKL